MITQQPDSTTLKYTYSTKTKLWRDWVPGLTRTGSPSNPTRQHLKKLIPLRLSSVLKGSMAVCVVPFIEASILDIRRQTTHLQSRTPASDYSASYLTASADQAYIIICLYWQLISTFWASQSDLLRKQIIRPNSVLTQQFKHTKKHCSNLLRNQNHPGTWLENP